MLKVGVDRWTGSSERSHSQDTELDTRWQWMKSNYWGIHDGDESQKLLKQQRKIVIFEIRLQCNSMRWTHMHKLHIRGKLLWWSRFEQIQCLINYGSLLDYPECRRSMLTEKLRENSLWNKTKKSAVIIVIEFIHWYWIFERWKYYQRIKCDWRFEKRLQTSGSTFQHSTKRMVHRRTKISYGIPSLCTSFNSPLV